MSNPNIYKKELKDLLNVEFGMICAKIARNSFLINKLCSLWSKSTNQTEVLWFVSNNLMAILLFIS